MTEPLFSPGLTSRVLLGYDKVIKNGEKSMEKLKSQITVKDTLITIGILGATSVAVYLLQQFVSSNSDSHVPLLFVLAVLFISRFTDGYIYGLVASMVA